MICFIKYQNFVVPDKTSTPGSNLKFPDNNFFGPVIGEHFCQILVKMVEQPLQTNWRLVRSILEYVSAAFLTCHFIFLMQLKRFIFPGIQVLCKANLHYHFITDWGSLLIIGLLLRYIQSSNPVYKLVWSHAAEAQTNCNVRGTSTNRFCGFISISAIEMLQCICKLPLTCINLFMWLFLTRPVIW